jgi:hypothetical protein
MRSPRRIVLIAVGVVLTASVVFGQEAAIRRFGLFVGANDGGPDRVTLRWAIADAQRMAEVMTEIGGIAPQDCFVLQDPDVRELEIQIDYLTQRIGLAAESAGRTEFVIYYSGHSDENGMMMGGDHISYLDFRRAIDDVGADVCIAILDSCASGAFTRLKGGQFTQPFLLDDGSEMSGHAFLASSSEDEASQESDTLRSSFFTHYLVSGLRGAADRGNDGRVTLDEVYLYAREETLTRTINTFAGPQNPSFDFQLTGTGSLVLTNLAVVDAAIVFDESVDGRLYITRASGGLVAEVDKTEGSPLTIALPADSYVITLEGENRNYSHELTLPSGERAEVAGRDFRVAFLDRNRVRGDTEEPTPVSVTVLPGLSLVGNDPNTTTISIGILIADAYRVQGGMISPTVGIAREDLVGVQISGVGNVVNGNLTGYQNSGVFNIVSGNSAAAQIAGVFNHVEGSASILQAAGLYNISGAGFNGFQTAGLFNLTRGPLNGIQISGGYNQAGLTHGAQISLINVAGDVTGAQIGLINVGKRVVGTQIGLVNISEEMHGVPIGLANVVERGIHNVSMWWEGEQRTWIGVQNGSNIVYSLAYAGIATDGEWRELDGFGVGAGAGVRIDARPFYLDVDFSYKIMSEGSSVNERFASLFDPLRGAGFPSMRVMAGVSIGGGLGWFFGGSLDVESQAGWDHIGYFDDTDNVIDLGGPGELFRLHPTFFTGFKL